MFTTIGLVLLSWFRVLGRFIRDAFVFYYRLLTNKIGLPRWLWLSILLLLAFNIGFYLVTGK